MLAKKITHLHAHACYIMHACILTTVSLHVYCETPDNDWVGNDDYINTSIKVDVSLNSKSCIS